MTTISMPQLGETIIEGTILKWLKQEGETIERDEPLFEISTDKVDTEVPSPVTGTVCEDPRRGRADRAGRHRPRRDLRGRCDGGRRLRARRWSDIAASEAAAPRRRRPRAESASAVAEGSAAEMPAVEPATPQGAEATTASATSPEPARSGGSGDLPDRGPRSRILSPLVRRLADEHGLDLSRSRAAVREVGSPSRTCCRRSTRAARPRPSHAGSRRGAGAGTRAAAPRRRRHPRSPPSSPRWQAPATRSCPISHIRKLIGAAHARLARDLRARLDDGRGQHRPPREAAGAGQGGVQGQARRQPHVPAVRDPCDLRCAPRPSPR